MIKYILPMVGLMLGYFIADAIFGTEYFTDHYFWPRFFLSMGGFVGGFWLSATLDEHGW